MKIRAVRVAQFSLIGTVAALGWLGLRSAAPQQKSGGVRSTIALLPLSRWSWDIKGGNAVPVRVPLRPGEAVLVHQLRRHRDGTTVSLGGLWVRRTQNESGFENRIFFSLAEIAAGSLPPGTRTIRATLAEGEEMAFGWDEHSHTLGMWVPGRYRRLGFLGIGQSSTLQWPSPATP